jgi:glycine/D-amino acid oxidase-like deaminating enzyme
MRNLYVQTSRPQVTTPRLEQTVTADIAIIGGGYTGLSAALHLAQRGLKPVLVDADEIGHGCSGRNGGQVNSGLKHLPDEVEARWPGGLGKRFSDLSFEAPGLVFDLIAEHGIDCAPMRTGSIRAAIDAAGVGYVTAFAEQCAGRGAAVRLLDAGEMKTLTGASAYRAGALDPRCGHINPLAYARGLAQAAQQAGAALYGHSRAISLSREQSSWRIATERGAISAANIVVATNGYTDGLWPGLAQTHFAYNTCITATDPLPDRLRQAIMPCGAALFEAAWDVVYYRVDEAGRLLMGGRGPQRNLRGPADVRHLVRHACKLWPGLEGVDWPWAWCGTVAITRDHYPHLTIAEPGAYLMLGYNGRGIAMATAAGQQLARLIASGGTDDIDIPVRTALDRIPLHRFWRIGASVTIARHLIADKLRGR